MNHKRLSMKSNLYLSMLLTALILYLPSCSGFEQKSLKKNLFGLDIKPPANSENQIAEGKRLIVRDLQIASDFDSHQFIYRTSPDKYTHDFYNGFTSYPARLISEKISEILTATPLFTTLNPSGPANQDFRLSGKILELYGDYRDKTSPSAVINIRLILEKNAGPRFEPCLTQTYLQTIPMEKIEPANLARGFGKGLQNIVEALIADFSKKQR